jgi:two-component system NtrC family sensor kinase
MSGLPIRTRFSLVVAAIALMVSGAVWWTTLRLADRLGSATLWIVLSGSLLLTLLVDQAARRQIYSRLARIRETMRRAAAGQLSARVADQQLDEIGVIARGLNEILAGLEQLNQAVEVRVEAATEAFRQESVAIADTHREMAVLSEELARAGRLAALGQAAANMAHQIGTPLNLISAYVQILIQSTPADAESMERLRAIQEQTNKVAAIVRAALDSSRGAAVPHTKSDLGLLVRRLCQMAGPMLEEAKVQIEVIAPSDPLEILADPVQLELALLNLITNSIDAMASGGTLTVRLGRTDDGLRLVLEDSGGGIPPDMLSHIFDPWVTTKPQGKGSGLGLSIARQVIASHGGTIRADNRVGRGAVFTIDLPAWKVIRALRDTSYAENSRR